MRRGGCRSVASPLAAHLDVPVRDVDVVQEADGRADVPHDLRRLWEEQREGEATLSQSRSSPGAEGENVDKNIATPSGL